jgi:hypothetical protein
MVPDHIIQEIQRASPADKYLATVQILLGIFLTLGATLLAIGSTFAAAMITTAGDQFTQNMRMSAIYYVGGFLLLVLGVKFFGKVFGKIFAKDKGTHLQTEKVKILVDEMLDGTDEMLRNLGHEAFSVKKLKEKGEKLQSDYSILKYAETHNMILLTEDDENIDACKENGIRFVEHGQNDTFENLMSELKKISIG